MVSASLGLIFAATITIVACLSSSTNYSMYLDKMSVLIVLGGTFSAALITFNFKQLINLGYSLSRVFTREMHHAGDIVKEMVEMADKINKNPAAANGLIDGVSHPFMKDGLRLIANDFDAVTIENVLSCSITERKNAHLGHVDIMRALAKYPPAFGMVGTVIGLVALLQNISTEGGIGRIGPNMAVALTATLYGLIDVTVSNVDHKDSNNNSLTGFQTPWFSGSRWGVTGSLNAEGKLVGELKFQLPAFSHLVAVTSLVLPVSSIHSLSS